MIKAVLFKSGCRFELFKQKLKQYNIKYDILDFDNPQWLHYDYSNIDFIIYYPNFKFTSNHPQAVYQAHDNLTLLQNNYPKLCVYPDPKIIHFYNDKYRQFLFLAHHNFPIPETIPLYSMKVLEDVVNQFGFPLIIKNRFGAGGSAVFKVEKLKELKMYFNVSRLKMFDMLSLRYFLHMGLSRKFYYLLIKEQKMGYPFLSYPLLAQRMVDIDRDVRVVVGNGKVVEAHWRISPNESQWKVNIDAGGIGEWSKIPDNIIKISEKLAKELNASWVALDILYRNDSNYYITEFSPVWHHYAYKEKSTFVYKDDYNIDVPLEISLDLEKIIIESLVNAVKENKS